MDTAPGWMISCATCGHARRASDVGVVRLGAPSWSRKMTLGRCSACGRARWLRVWHESRPDLHVVGGIGRQLTTILALCFGPLGVAWLIVAFAGPEAFLVPGAIAAGAGLALLVVSRLLPEATPAPRR